MGSTVNLWDASHDMVFFFLCKEINREQLGKNKAKQTPKTLESGNILEKRIANLKR